MNPGIGRRWKGRMGGQGPPPEIVKGRGRRRGPPPGREVRLWGIPPLGCVPVFVFVFAFWYAGEPRNDGRILLRQVNVRWGQDLGRDVKGRERPAIAIAQSGRM